MAERDGRQPSGDRRGGRSGLRRFGLARDPFAPVPDPALFVPTLGHADACERLTLAVERRRGLAVVLGEPGYGKSTLKAALLDHLLADESLVIGTIDDPRECRTDVQFLRAVLGEFGVPATGRTGLDLTTDFRRALAAFQAAGQSVLLVIDEGHHLASSQLDILRTFLSFEGQDAAPIGVVVFAEPELEEKITRKRNLAQRVRMIHRLNPFNRRDTAKVIATRVAKAGWAAETPLFDAGAVALIHERTDGVPAEVILLCRECLSEAAERGHERVTAEVVAEVVARRDGVGTGTQLALLGEPVPVRPVAALDAQGQSNGRRRASEAAAVQTTFVATDTLLSRARAAARSKKSASGSPKGGLGGRDYDNVTSGHLENWSEKGVSLWPKNYGVYIEGQNE